MIDREKVVKGLESLRDVCNAKADMAVGEGRTVWAGYASVAYLALALLREQEPRVMTLEEVQQHYSLPPIFPDDFGMQEDYLNDIAPLYFDFPQADDSWIVHWRRYNDVAEHLKEWAPSYGRKWRCWTGKPTKEQREATPWID